MKKILLFFVMVVSLVILCGCNMTNRSNMNVEVEDHWYANTNDTKYVSTYNGYVISSYDIQETDGGYIVTLNVIKTDSQTITK